MNAIIIVYFLKLFLCVRKISTFIAFHFTITGPMSIVRSRRLMRWWFHTQKKTRAKATNNIHTYNRTGVGEAKKKKRSTQRAAQRWQHKNCIYAMAFFFPVSALHYYQQLCGSDQCDSIFHFVSLHLLIHIYYMHLFLLFSYALYDMCACVYLIIIIIIIIFLLNALGFDSFFFFCPLTIQFN